MCNLLFILVVQCVREVLRFFFSYFGENQGYGKRKAMATWPFSWFAGLVAVVCLLYRSIKWNNHA